MKPLSEFVGARGVTFSGVLRFLLPVTGLLAMLAGFSISSPVTAWLGGICSGIFMAPHLAIWMCVNDDERDISQLTLISKMPHQISRAFVYLIITLALGLTFIATWFR